MMAGGVGFSGAGRGIWGAAVGLAAPQRHALTDEKVRLIRMQNEAEDLSQRRERLPRIAPLAVKPPGPRQCAVCLRIRKRRLQNCIGSIFGESDAPSVTFFKSYLTNARNTAMRVCIAAKRAKSLDCAWQNFERMERTADLKKL
jgi:hypothetical protein